MKSTAVFTLICKVKIMWKEVNIDPCVPSYRKMDHFTLQLGCISVCILEGFDCAFCFITNEHRLLVVDGCAGAQVWTLFIIMGYFWNMLSAPFFFFSCLTSVPILHLLFGSHLCRHWFEQPSRSLILQGNCTAVFCLHDWTGKCCSMTCSRQYKPSLSCAV